MWIVESRHGPKREVVSAGFWRRHHANSGMASSHWTKEFANNPNQKAAEGSFVEFRNCSYRSGLNICIHGTTQPCASIGIWFPGHLSIHSNGSDLGSSLATDPKHSIGIHKRQGFESIPGIRRSPTAPNLHVVNMTLGAGRQPFSALKISKIARGGLDLAWPESFGKADISSTSQV